MNIALIGAGKMGLPLACVFADRGANVIACDVNPEVVQAINAGKSPIDEPGVQEILQRAVQAGRLSATADTPAAVARSEVVVVIVPVLLTPEKKADTAHHRKRHPPDRPGPAARDDGLVRDDAAHRRHARAAADPRIRRTPRRTGLRPRLLAGARQEPARHRAVDAEPEDRRRPHARSGGARGGVLWRVPRRAGHQRRLARNRRDGQARRDGLPRRQHRPRQRAGAVLRSGRD